MKQIKSYIRANMIDNVIDALENLPEPPGATIAEVRGFGHTKEPGPARLIECVKLEVMVPDNQVDRVVNCIIENARTGEGHHGDGTIFITALENAIRIRNAEQGEQALRPAIPGR